MEEKLECVQDIWHAGHSRAEQSSLFTAEYYRERERTHTHTHTCAKETLTQTYIYTHTNIYAHTNTHTQKETPRDTHSPAKWSCNPVT